MDERLWKIENYRDFLAARRELLAKAANDFLDQLYRGEMPETGAPVSTVEPAAAPRPISIASDEEEAGPVTCDGLDEREGPAQRRTGI